MLSSSPLHFPSSECLKCTLPQIAPAPPSPSERERAAIFTLHTLRKMHHPPPPSPRRGGGRPTPPPRDPAGIHTIVRSLLDLSADDFLDDEMSSDSGSSPTRAAPPQVDNSKRRSSYENVQATPHRPPSCPTVRRSTPSPSRPRASPAPCRHSAGGWGSGDEGAPPPVRRRPASACGGRTPRQHRGSMPPVECHGGDVYRTWGGHGCSPCCGAAPVQPYHWCGGPQTWGHYHHQSNDSAHDCEDLLQQRIWQLEVEKEQLTLQVNVLSEQVEAQNEKIEELETTLSRSKEQLDASEALLRKEMNSRSSVENSKLDLLAQISELRSRLLTTESEKRDIQERNRKLENELILTAAYLAEKEADLTAFKSKLIHNGGMVFDTNPELEKLKKALSSVMAVNDEKERKIQDLKSSLQRYKKLHELVLSNYSMKNSEGFAKIAPYSEDNFLTALDNLASCGDINDVVGLTEKPPPVPGRQQNFLSVSDSPFSSLRLESPFSSPRYSSSENVNPPTPQKTPPSKRHYSTLPRPHQADVLKQYDSSPSPKTTSPGLTTGSHSTHDLRRHEVRPSPVRAKQSPSSGSSFGRGFFRLRLGKRSSSAPQLAPDKLEETELFTPVKTVINDRRTSSPITSKEKVKGLRKIFGKVKRSGSDSLSNSTAELKRGGIRATAGPRLGWSEDNRTKRNSFKVSEPFSKWDCELVCEWLQSIGLGMYASDCRRWGKGGEHLLKATTAEFEKDLNVRNPLHRKKLLLALLGAKEEVEPVNKIDHQWVVRWLDDIGLPQYKDAFYDGRVDGRMLHHLTLEDLSLVKVTNLLHHISIKTGIQVLRENHFDPHALQRRSLPEDDNAPCSVSRWTNHRVMEWLRTVDLSEYAPNLRGSGVHGGLMMYEARFDADLMATLLNIPPSKTLLRRHLSTQFKQLIGPEVMQKKREATHQPLSPSAKVKSLKRSPFSLVKRRNKSNEFELDDYVCPMNPLGDKILFSSQNRTEEEKFLMKEVTTPVLYGVKE